MRYLSIFISLLFFSSQINAQEIEDEAVQWLQDFIRVDTINPPGNEYRAVEFYAKIFEEEGIAYSSAESAPGRGNIWARLEGGDEPALILLQHTDVVPADLEYWTTDPLSGELRDGYILGRGARDMKGTGISHLAAFLSLHRSGRPLNRDVVFVASADDTGKQDGYLIASSSGDIAQISPCLTEDDYFVSSAAQAIYWKYSYSFSGTNHDVLHDSTIVKPAVSSLTDGLLNVISLGRGQLYSKVDRMNDLAFSFALIGMSAFLWLNHMQHQRRNSRIDMFESAHMRSSKADEQHLDKNAESEMVAAYAQIVENVQPQVHKLEDHIRRSVKSNHTTYSVEQVEVTLHLCDTATV